jgi:hypothetical protein
MSEERMTTAWATALRFEGDGDALFDRMKAEFIRENEFTRLKGLEVVDSWLNEEIAPTREHAAMLTRKRELEDLHRLLKRAGR